MKKKSEKEQMEEPLRRNANNWQGETEEGSGPKEISKLEIISQRLEKLNG